jgi:succinate dehydrogenase / fumarate reductase cytochrome b subunit
MSAGTTTGDRTGGQPVGGTPSPAARRRGIAGWFDPRGRRLGGWAFAINRLTGLALVFYLYLHFVVLSRLAAGPSTWDSLVDTLKSPIFLALDVVLIFGILYHGLNGIRVALVGYGIVLDRQRALFVSLMIFGAIVLVIAALRIFR